MIAKPFVTVAICTRNRAEHLRKVLSSLAEMEVRADVAWELVLVDNGSTDDTKDVIHGFEGTLPIRYSWEPQAGLSRARNRALDEAAGQFICWTDDDVLVDRLWLQSYVDAFARSPDDAFFGGPVVPVLIGRTPSWFRDNRPLLARLVAERDLGTAAVELGGADDELPYGANFAVRADANRRNRFDEMLGVSPHQRRLGEETEVLRAIAREGGTGRWVPGARVRHLIPEARQTLSYVRQYENSSGETWAYLARLRPQTPEGRSLVGKTCWRGVPLGIWRNLATARMRYWVRRLSGAPSQWLPPFLEQAFWQGAVAYLKR